MMLYHGTSERYLNSILKSGLTPRGNQNSNWNAESQRDFVYLTSCYPVLFACNAAKKNEAHIIVEIEADDLDDSLCYPDDDFIWHAATQQKNHISLEEAGKLITYNQELWRMSLTKMGCIAFRGIIPGDYITRILKVEPTKMDSQAKVLYYGFADVSISPTIFSLREPRYQRELRWLFGDVDSPEDPSDPLYFREERRVQILKEITKKKSNWTSIIFDRGD